MNVTRRTTAAVGLVAVGALAMAGCSGGADDAGGGVTLNYFTWNNEANMQPIIDAFEEAHPDITIELSSANNNPQEYGETLLTRASGNQLPDVFHLSLEQRRKLNIEELPGSLDEALRLTEKSSLVKDTLGDHVFTKFLENKRIECDKFRIQVTKYELERYLPML